MKIQCNFKIDEAVHRRLKMLAAARGEPLSAILEEAIAQYEDSMKIDVETINATAKREWEKSAALQSEFSTLAAYQAWKHAVAKGFAFECPAVVKK